jgi:hypothetical protein
MDDEREDDYEPEASAILIAGGRRLRTLVPRQQVTVLSGESWVATAAPEQWITKFVSWLRQMNSTTRSGCAASADSLLLLLRPLIGVSFKNEVTECHCSVDDQYGMMRRRFIFPNVPITHLVAETR